MGTSAKRLGLETGDLELELRLRRIEVELEKKVDSNIDAEETGRSRSVPPQVTGFRVSGQTPGTVTMAWNPSQISDLRRYQIQFAEDGGFSTNLQTFNTRDTSFTFSTASEDGGAGGTAFLTRVRVQNSIGQFSVFSVVINTATGEVVGGDLASDSVGPDAIDIPALVAALTLPGPSFGAGDSNKFLKVNSAATAYEFIAGTLPPLAASGDVGKLIRVAAANDFDYTSYTFPSTATSGKLLRANGTNWVETGFTFPSAATVANYLRGDGTNYLNREGTLPPLAASGDTDKVAYVSAADTIAYFDQDPTDAAATTTTHFNRKGTVTLPGGFKLHWDTINTITATDFTVATFTAVRSVMVCWGESAGIAATATVKAYISTANTTITIRQDSGGDMEITYWAIEEV